MVEGKLGDHGREPTNVQVVIEDDEDGVKCVSLTDLSGVFLGPEAIHDARGSEDGESGSQSQEEQEESEAWKGNWPRSGHSACNWRPK